MAATDKAGLREDKLHGTPSFPLGVYRIRRVSELVLHYHWHEEWEFLLMEVGSARIQVEGGWFRLDPGMAVLIPGGALHSGYSLVKGGECRYIAVVFNPVLLTGHAGAACNTGVFDPKTPWQAEVLGHIQGMIGAVSGEAPGYRLMTLGHLLQAFALMQANGSQVQHGGADPVKSRNMARFRAVLDHIHKRYPETLGIADLSAVAGLSPYHFCRFFKSMSGRTPMGYVNMYRVERASMLLSGTDSSVMDTALDCGFGNLSYFIKTFKRYQGCTPTEFRRGLARKKG